MLLNKNFIRESSDIKGKIIKEFPIDLVEENLEGLYEDDHIDGLLEDVRKNGIKIPLMVKIKNNGMCEIVNGKRRFWVAKKLKLSTVPIQII